MKNTNKKNSEFTEDELKAIKLGRAKLKATKFKKGDSIIKSPLMKIHKVTMNIETTLDLTCQHCGTRFEFKFFDKMINSKLRLPTIDPYGEYLKKKQ